jgi:drug/metabolite transporter (DMT)-like permease
MLAAAALFLAGGYHFIIRSTRLGDLSVVAPFRYVGLLMAVALGWAVWGDVPNLLASAGIALVVVSGLVLLRWQRRGVQGSPPHVLRPPATPAMAECGPHSCVPMPKDERLP